MEINKIYNSDCLEGLKLLPDELVDCCVTSPPYFNLRDYGCDGQIGLENTPEEYISKLVDVFREVKRVLKNDGTLWVNIGDCFAGSMKGGANYPDNTKNYKQGTNKGALGKSSIVKKYSKYKNKDLIGIPWMLAFALRSDGWYLRQDIIWHKPNPMPESVTDRCTKSHEYIFLLSKNSRYLYDYKAIAEKSEWAEKDKRFINGPTQSEKSKDSQWQCNKQGVYRDDMLRNKRDVWTVKPASFKDAHFATFPERLIVDCIKAGCPVGGVVLDPFMGAGTTAVVARKLERNYIGFELNREYVELAEKRLKNEIGIFN